MKNIASVLLMAAFCWITVHPKGIFGNDVDSIVITKASISDLKVTANPAPFSGWGTKIWWSRGDGVVRTTHALNSIDGIMDQCPNY